MGNPSSNSIILWHLLKGINMKSNRIGSMVNSQSRLACLAEILCACVLIIGCDNHSQSFPAGQAELSSKNKEFEKEFSRELKTKKQEVDRMLEPYSKNGLLKVTTEPSDAEIYIDDGLVTIPDKGLMLPIGTYTLKAVWRDGKEISRKVFVTPALQHAVSWNWKASRNVDGGSGSEKSNINFDATLSPTMVTLIKPGS